ncbi:MAG: dodecin [archaeon]
MVFKKVTLQGTSPESFEAATDEALNRATQTIDHVKWAEVQDMGIEIASVDEPEYQVELEIAFEVTPPE